MPVISRSEEYVYSSCCACAIASFRLSSERLTKNAARSGSSSPARLGGPFMADFFGLGSLPAARLCHGLAPDGEGCGTAVDFAQFEASEKGTGSSTASSSLTAISEIDI